MTDVVDGLTTEPATPVVEPPQPEHDWQAEAKKWKETSLKVEARANAAAAEAKANAAAALRLKEIEDRDLSDLQRAQREIEEYKTRAAAAERAQLRTQVALDKGLPPEILAALVGETAEELTAHADSLLAWRGNAAPAPNPVPRPDLSQGATPSPVDASGEALFAAYKASTSSR
jgi:hypothetical protein